VGMKTRVICLALLCLLLLSSPAFATKWVQVFSFDNDDVWFVDLDKVSKSTITITDAKTNQITEYNSIIYWLRVDPTETLEGATRKITSMRRIEEITARPYYYRPIEGYFYYNDNPGKRFPLKLDAGTVSIGDEYYEKIMDVALPYAN
jgi:hypothetical protein